MGLTVKADPYEWPYDGNMEPQHTALIVIDMQHDFCGGGGYVDKMGYDLSLTALAIEPIKHVLEAVRKIPGLTVIHTREGHRADLADCPPNKLWRSKKFWQGSVTLGPRDEYWSVEKRAGILLKNSALLQAS